MMVNWPKHEDGSDKKMGEMTRQEKHTVLYASRTPMIIDALVTALEAARDDVPAHLRSDKLMKQIGAALALARGEG